MDGSPSDEKTEALTGESGKPPLADVVSLAFKQFTSLLSTNPRQAYELARDSKELRLQLGRIYVEDSLKWQKIKDTLTTAGVKPGQVNEVGKVAKEEFKNERKSQAKQDAQRTFIDTRDQLRELVAKAKDALVAGNARKPSVYRQEDHLVRIRNTQFGIDIKELELAELRHELSRCADWGCVVQREDGDAIVPQFPPTEVVAALAAHPPRELPELEAIASVPFFAADGKLISTNGYHPEARVFLKLDPTLTIPEVPAAPSEAEVEAAMALLKDMLCDVKFDAAADRAHYLALLLEPFARKMMRGVCPGHFIEAPRRDSGKTMLGNITAIITTGEPMQWKVFPYKEEEREKTIFSTLRSGVPYAAFDNLRGKLESAALEAALTSSIYVSRILGVSKDASVRNLISWVLTGNNVEVNEDMWRRLVRTRIDPGEAPPEGRTYRHPDIYEWVRTHRAELIHALLVLVQNWIAKGKRAPSRFLSSFEGWSRTVGGILEETGVEGFLAQDAKPVVDDTEDQEGAALVTKLFERFRYGEFTTDEVFNIVKPGFEERVPQYLPSQLGLDPSQHMKKLGYWFRKNRDVIFAGFRLVRAEGYGHKKIAKYRLVPETDAAHMEAMEFTKQPGPLETPPQNARVLGVKVNDATGRIEILVDTDPF